MLEEPRSHDVGGHFGKDAPLLVAFLFLIGVVVVPCAWRGHAVVQAVTCHMTRYRKRQQISDTQFCLLPAFAAPRRSKGIKYNFEGILEGFVRADGRV